MMMEVQEKQKALESEKKPDDDFTDEDKIESDLNLWDYKENKELIGVVVKIDDEGTFGRQVIVDTKDTEGVTLPSLKVLNNRLKGLIVGNIIKVVNLGKAEGKTYYDFDVYIKDK